MLEMNKKVATSIGTKVYYGFESVPNTRPTLLSAFHLLEDCTSHPDFNPEREQIETTTLVQTNNKTYTQGLKDFGTLEFGFNLTQDVADLFLDEENGILAQYKEKIAEGLRMWLCIDIQGINKSFFIPVEPQDFGLPAGETNSKYDLVVRFNAVGDGTWQSDLANNYLVNAQLEHCTSSNTSTEIAPNGSYSATITAASNYTLTGAAVEVRMGGVDITAIAYSAGTITIASVTGNLDIKVIAVAA